MAERHWQDIWKEQCEAAEAIMHSFGVESAFDYVVGEKLVSFAQAAAERPEFAQALPGFVSRLRGMFTPEEMRENFARFEHRLRDMEEAAAEAPELSIEDPEAIAERARQLGLLKELLFAPSLGTS